MGMESCIGHVEISGKHGSRVDVGTMSGLERQVDQSMIWRRRLRVRFSRTTARRCTRHSPRLRGNAYAFKQLADRACGKLKEHHQLEILPYKDVSDEDLFKRIKQLEQQLGYSTPEVLP